MPTNGATMHKHTRARARPTVVHERHHVKSRPNVVFNQELHVYHAILGGRTPAAGGLPLQIKLAVSNSAIPLATKTCDFLAGSGESKTGGRISGLPQNDVQLRSNVRMRLLLRREPLELHVHCPVSA